MKHGFIVMVALSAVVACGPPAGVRTHVTGRLGIRAEIDSTGDGSGFEVAILSANAGEADTLAFAVTDSSGIFRMDVEAPERGIYPIVVSRGDRPLAFEEIVLAAGDSVRVRASFPLGGRPMRIVSRENAAWSAFRNTKAAFSQAISSVMGAGEYELDAVRQTVIQSANLHWSLREIYAGTMAAALGEAESVMLLEGWDDSLSAARFASLPVDHPAVVEALRAARRAVARLAGQDSALALLDAYARRVPAGKRAAVRSEVVMAHLDSLERAPALEAARRLAGEKGAWGRWAGRAVYELENLMPGMRAPAFTVVDRRGRTVSLDDLRGLIVLLEFFRPDEAYLGDLVVREALLGLSDRMPFATVSVSLEPDSLMNEALFEGRSLTGTFAVEPDGLESAIAASYNVNVLPTRVLIDAEGLIVAKYAGTGLDGVQRDLGTVLRSIAARRP